MALKPMIMLVVPSLWLLLEDIIAIDIAMNVLTITPEMVPNTKMFFFIILIYFND
jgi:hypothetical protein